MLQTYTATLDGDRIEWDDGEKPALTHPTRIIVTVIDPAMSPRRRLPPSDKAGIAAALDEIAKMGGIKSFGDPLEWQRETRKDGPLPGREDD